MRIENFPKLKRCDHSPKRDEFIDVSLDPPYFSLDSPFKVRIYICIYSKIVGPSRHLYMVSIMMRYMYKNIVQKITVPEYDDFFLERSDI